MPSHQERIRLKNPEMNCNHFYIYHAGSDITPFILENGMRETIKYCLYCNSEIRVVRSQEEFEKELERLSPQWDKRTIDLSHLEQDVKNLLK